MVVDGFRVADGQLQKGEGISMELHPPVYFGSGKFQPVTDTQACYNTLLLYLYCTCEQYNDIFSLYIATWKEAAFPEMLYLSFFFLGQTFPSEECNRMHPQHQV